MPTICLDPTDPNNPGMSPGNSQSLSLNGNEVSLPFDPSFLYNDNLFDTLNGIGSTGMEVDMLLLDGSQNVNFSSGSQDINFTNGQNINFSNL